MSKSKLSWWEKKMNNVNFNEMGKGSELIDSNISV